MSLAALRFAVPDTRFLQKAKSQLSAARLSVFQKHNGRITRAELPPRFVRPAHGLDLSQGMGSQIGKGENEKAPVSDILSAAEEAKVDLSKFQFVSYRNNFNKILSTPYSDDAWDIDIVRTPSLIALEIVKEAEKKFEGQAAIEYYARRFENVCCNRDSEAVNLSVETCATFAVQLGGHSILMGAEIDCCEERAQTGADNPAFVELKLNIALKDPGKERNFIRYKLLKFWIQSALVGTPIIFVGFRDDKGTLLHTTTVATGDLPAIAARQSLTDHWFPNKVRPFARPYPGGSPPWTSDACVNFADQLLSWVKTETSPGFSYRLSYVPRDRAVLLKKLL